MSKMVKKDEDLVELETTETTVKEVKEVGKQEAQISDSPTQTPFNFNLVVQALRTIGVNLDVPSLELIIAVTMLVQQKGFNINLLELNGLANQVNEKYSKDGGK